MDEESRQRIQRTTQEARRVLRQDFAEQLEGTHDICIDGAVAPAARGRPDLVRRSSARSPSSGSTCPRSETSAPTR